MTIDLVSELKKETLRVAAAVGADPKTITVAFVGRWMDGDPDDEDDPPIPVTLSCDLLIPARDRRYKEREQVVTGSGTTIEAALAELKRNIAWAVKEGPAQIVPPPSYLALGPACWGVGSSVAAARTKARANASSDVTLAEIGAYELPPNAKAAVDNFGRVVISGEYKGKPKHVVGPDTIDWA